MLPVMAVASTMRPDAGSFPEGPTLTPPSLESPPGQSRMTVPGDVILPSEGRTRKPSLVILMALAFKVERRIGPEEIAQAHQAELAGEFRAALARIGARYDQSSVYQCHGIGRPANRR